MQSSHVKKMDYPIYKHIIEYLQFQGFTPKSVIPKADFLQIIGIQPFVDIEATRDSGSSKICVYYLPSTTVKVKNVTTHVSNLESKGWTKDKITCILTSDLKTAQIDRIKKIATLYHHEHFFVNFTKHVTWRPFRILSNDDVSKLCGHFRVNIIQLPEVKVTDPCSRMLNAKVGDIISMDDYSEISLDKLFVRRVIL